jgi:hypothetical protein
MMIYSASQTAARGVATLALAALFGIFGCSISSKPKSTEAGSEGNPEAPKEVVPDLSSAAHCIVNMMQNPRERFHLSMLRKDDDVPYPFTSEADFTPDTLEGTSNWKSGQDTRTISNVHSDASAWDASVMLLAAPLSTAATGEMRMAQPTVTTAGDDPIGGYDTIKYVFDTARLSQAEKVRYEGLLKAQDFSVVGTAWITKDTHCLVKFVTDYNFTAKNGTLGSTHCEGSVTKQ